MVSKLKDKKDFIGKKKENLGAGKQGFEP